MSGVRERKEILKLPSGVTTTLKRAPAVDWESVQALAEAGVPYKEICRLFKGLTVSSVTQRGRRNGWLTPNNTKAMLKELGRKQREALARRGETRSKEDLIEEIWVERGERINEKSFQLAEQALDAAIKEEKGKTLIRGAADLKTVMEVGRRVTGLDRREEEQTGTKMASMIGFLRSVGGSTPAPPPIDV